MNYNSVNERFKKGSILVREEVRFPSLRNLKTYPFAQGRFYFWTIRGVWAYDVPAKVLTSSVDRK